MFEIANERKFRYPFRGQITTEDLFDLNKSELNEIYKILNASVKSDEVTLLDSKTEEDENLLLKIEIVKTIFDKRVEAEKKLLHERDVAAKKQRIMAIMCKQDDEKLENTSTEDLQKMLDEL